MANDNDGAARTLDAHFKEYEALRAEMEWLIRDGSQYQNFAIVLLGSIGAIVDWMIKDQTPVFIPPTLLFAVFLFCLLGFLFFRQHEEVYVIADYILTCVRPQVVKLTGSEYVWNWEAFKAERNQKLYGASLFNRVPMSSIVLWLRMALFVAPSLIILGIFFVVYLGPQSIPVPYPSDVRVWLWAAFFVDAVIVLGLVGYLAFEANLPARILGSHSRKTQQQADMRD